MSGRPALLSGNSRLPAASPAGRYSAAGSPSAAGAARGIGKRSRQDASVPAPVPNKQQAAGGEGSTRKRPRGMAQALIPQAVPAGPSAGPHPQPPPHIATMDATQTAPACPSAVRAPPPPPSAAAPRRPLHRLAAVSVPLVDPSCGAVLGIPAAVITPPTAPPGLPIAKAGGRPTTGRADLLQLGDVHREVAPPVISVGGPSGEEPDLSAGAAFRRPRAAHGSDIQAERPAVAPVVDGLHSTEGEQTADARLLHRRPSPRAPADGAPSQLQAPTGLIVDSPNKRYGHALINSLHAVGANTT